MRACSIAIRNDSFSFTSCAILSRRRSYERRAECLLLSFLHGHCAHGSTAQRAGRRRGGGAVRRAAHSPERSFLFRRQWRLAAASHCRDPFRHHAPTAAASAAPRYLSGELYATLQPTVWELLPLLRRHSAELLRRTCSTWHAVLTGRCTVNCVGVSPSPGQRV